jgi:hypothetical protein
MKYRVVGLLLTLNLALAAVGGMLLFRSLKPDHANGSISCAGGEVAENEIDALGRSKPRTEHFTSLTEAEAFVCRRIPHVTQSEKLSLLTVTVERSTSIEQYSQGNGQAVAVFQYASLLDGGELGVVVTLPPQGGPDLSGSRTSTIAGHVAYIHEQQAMTVVHWKTDDYALTAIGALTDEFTLDRMLAVLESVR